MLSVVIPLYNKESTVIDSVQSALNVIGLYQVIVVDDGSTDNSFAQLQKLKDSRLKIIQQDNAGPGSARNRGLELCQTEYVLFLDADDQLYPDIFVSSKDIFQTYSDCAAVIHSWHAGDDRYFDRRRYNLAELSAGLFKLPISISGKTFKRVVDLCHSGSIIAKTEEVRANGGFFDEYKSTYGEDSYLWIRMLLKSKVYFTLKPKMWFNTSASELGIGRIGLKPSRPIVVKASRTRETTPHEYLPAFQRLIDFYVILEAKDAICANNFRHLYHLTKSHPRIFFKHPKLSIRIIKCLPSFIIKYVYNK